MTDWKPRDRVLIKPLGVKGTVLVVKPSLGIIRVQADNGGPPLPWRENELEPVTEGE
jgi:predicted ATPase